MTTTVPAPADTAAPEGLSHRRILIIYGALMLGTLVAALDQTIIATALPTIVGDLGGLNHLSWVVTGYLLTSTCSTPVWGKLGDLHGRKLMFQASIVVFLVGSILSGLSQSMMELILFRGLQGLGAGGLMSLPMAIIGDILSPRQRGRYQGYMVGVFSLASIAGPAIGGFFTQSLSWRWCFYVNIPIGIVALLVTASVLNLPFRKIQRRIDYLGAALLMGSVAGLLLVTVWGGSSYPWNSIEIISLIVVSVIMLAVFVWHEGRTEEPVLPLRLFRNSVIRVTDVISFLAGMAMFGATVYMPLFLQLVAGVSPILSGFLMFPMMAGVTVSSIVTGRLISRTGRYKLWPIMGSVLMPFGMYLLSTMNQNTPIWQAGLFMFPLGIGVGLIMPVLMVALQNAAEQKDLGGGHLVQRLFPFDGELLRGGHLRCDHECRAGLLDPQAGAEDRSARLGQLGGLQPGGGPPPARAGTTGNHRRLQPFPARGVPVGYPHRPADVALRAHLERAAAPRPCLYPSRPP